jgi:colanic acid/amylovoran biosynthesis glycosyltransferase
MHNPKKLTVWRNDVLGVSETFIHNQVEALTEWSATYAGSRYIPNQFGIQPAVIAKSPKDPGLCDLIARSDLVHAHFATDGAWVTPALTDSSRPFVVTLHGYDVTVRHLWWTPKARHQLSRMFERASALIAVSDFIAARAIKIGAPADKVRVHHIGIPVPLDETGKHRGRNGILFVGRLVPKKGADTMLAAVAALPTELRQTAIDIIGDGPMRNRLERQARSAGLNVTFHGAQPNEMVRQHMRSAALLCGPSRRAWNGDSEGLPITILEAAAHRLPVVATTASGIPEAIDDGLSGLLVPERCAEQLTQALRTMLSDEPMRKQFADCARARMESDFNIATQTRELEHLYNGL